MASASSGRREEASVEEGRRVTIQPSPEPVLLAGVNAEDARFSWRVALAVMLILSAVASVVYILNVNPFAKRLDISLVYLQTLVLVIGHFVTRARGIANSSAR